MEVWGFCLGFIVIFIGAMIYFGLVQSSKPTRNRNKYLEANLQAWIYIMFCCLWCIYISAFPWMLLYAKLTKAIAKMNMIRFLDHEKTVHRNV